jgi:hypothetical protein
MRNRIVPFKIPNAEARKEAGLRMAAILVSALLLASLVFSLTPLQPARAAGPFTVNTTSDTHCFGFISQSAPGCTSATDSGGNISLRSAMEYASTAGGTTTINLPSGTYNLSLGDLVAGTLANTNITLNGSGAATTILHQTTAGRMVIVVNYNVLANVVFSAANLTISGGSENENDPDGFGGNGGAILAGGSSTATGNSLTITNAVFSGNYCSPVVNAGCSGGAINMTGGGNLTVTNSSFTGNDASKSSGTGAGGAIYFDNGGNGGNVSITHSTFTNNTAHGIGGQGGAVRLAGGVGSTYTINSNTFTGNSAAQNGGALYLSLGSLTANFNRIVGNSSNSGSGLYVANNSGSIGSATNNWWGCNGDPSAAATGCDTAVLGTPNQGGSMTVNPWIVLTNAANPDPIQVNQTSTMTADFLHNSAGGSLLASQIPTLIGLPVSWGSAVRGALSGTQTTIQSNGTATATFTASAAGAGSAGATVDNGTGTASITINKADTTTTITSDSPDPTVTGEAYTVAFTVSSNTGSTPTAPTGTVTVSDGTDSCTGTLAAGQCSLTSTTVGSKSLTASYNGDSNFNTSSSSTASHMVNKADTTTTITSDTPDPSVVGQSVTFAFSVTVNSPGSGTPTGNVTVSDGGSNSCSAPVAAGQCNITFNSTGSDSMTASYPGDANFNISTSSAAAHTVNQADTTTTLSSGSPNPSAAGQSVTFAFSVTVNSPGSGTPTGNVTVSDGGSNSCSASAATGQCSVTFNSTGSYSMTASYAGDTNFNASNSSAVSQSVDEAPAVTTNPSDQNVDAGQIASFSAAASGFPTPTVQWQVSTDGGATFDDIPGATSTTLSFTAALTDDGSQYRAVFTNSVGTATTTAATLTVEAAPSITTNPSDLTVNAGQTASFNAAASSNPAPTVQWQISTDGGATFNDIPGATSTTLSFSAAFSDNGNEYRAVFTNDLGTATTTSATLTVDYAPLITTNPSDQSVIPGNTATFSAAADGNPIPTVQWQVSTDGGATFSDIPGATSTTLSFTAASSDNGNQYRAVFTNFLSTATTTAATLTTSVQITVGTSPSGLSFTVDGTTYSSQQIFSWLPSSSHTLSTNSPQPGTTGTQYAFNNWSDGGAISHDLTAPSAPTTYTATFDTQYELTTAANPSNGGSISPASGSYYTAGSMVSLSASANTGFTFSSWTGNVADTTSASTTITMNAPESVTANFSASTSLLYNGGQIVNIGGSFTPAALLSSPAISCVSGKTISFSLDADPTGGSSIPYLLGTATTTSNGQATMGSVNTTGWLEGVYTLTSSFGGSPLCDASSYDVLLTVASPGDSASGGGWYTVAGSGRVNFGFTVRKTDSKCTANCAYKGRMLLMNNGKWKLNGILDAYSKLSTGQGAASGTGDLYWWDSSLNGGLGDWALAQSGVAFTINFYDSGKSGKSSTDSFGINIEYSPVPPQPANLPNSTPQQLKGGDIKVK